MSLPNQAIIEFTSQDDICMLEDYFRCIGRNATADRLHKRKYRHRLCARIADGNFASFGHYDTYKEPLWDGFVSATEPQFVYCSVQHLLAWAGFLSCEEDESEDPDLDGLL